MMVMVMDAFFALLAVCAAITQRASNAELYRTNSPVVCDLRHLDAHVTPM